LRKRGSGQGIAELSEVILPPSRGLTRMITFVPDEFLFNVPFAALTDPRSGQALVELEEIVVAPVIQTAASPLSGNARRSRARVLVVTASGGGEEGGLPFLRAASREVNAARAFDASCLCGSMATPANFRHLAPLYDVIHFAGHGLYRADEPSSSTLQLATSAITADELVQMSYGKTRLVVLGACETAVTSERPTVVPNIASAFASAGVPAVVGTLWSVEDEAAARFFEAFYGRLSQGSTAAAAVRRAQQILRRHGDTDWPAFQLLGRDVSLG
jgi:CHAT domain-containing protein